MLRLLAVPALLVLVVLAVLPFGAERARKNRVTDTVIALKVHDDLMNSCMSIAPICPPGLHPACICYDAFGNNCSWQCVR